MCLCSCDTMANIHHHMATADGAVGLPRRSYTTGEAWNTAMHELFLSPASGDGTDMPAGTSCVESPTYEEMSDAWEVMVSNRTVKLLVYSRGSHRSLDVHRAVSSFLSCAWSKIKVRLRICVLLCDDRCGLVVNFRLNYHLVYFTLPTTRSRNPTSRGLFACTSTWVVDIYATGLRELQTSTHSKKTNWRRKTMLNHWGRLQGIGYDGFFEWCALQYLHCSRPLAHLRIGI